MLVRKRSIITGDTHVWDLDVTTEQIERWQAGAFVQDVFPHLSAEEREFLINGTTPREWEQYGLNEEE